MYIVVRTWENASELADAIAQRHDEVSDLIGTVPGFVAYYGVRSGETLTTVTVTNDEEGAQESTRRAGEWVKKNLAGTAIGTPNIVEGGAFITI